MAETGVCNLCGNRKELCNAHIFPKWCYGELRACGDTPKIYPSRKIGYPKRTQIGIYDPKILCKDCDNNILGVWDNYGRSILKDPPVPDQHSLDVGYYDIARVAYGKLKLFMLSVLWRAHLSTLPEFAAVDLGPCTANTIRNMLLGCTPGDPGLFSVIIGRYYILDAEYRDLLFTMPVPVRSNHSQLDFFKFRMLEYCIVMNVGDIAFPSEFGRFILSDKQDLRIRLRDYMQSKDFENAKRINSAWE